MSPYAHRWNNALAKALFLGTCTGLFLGARPASSQNQPTFVGQAFQPDGSNPAPVPPRALTQPGTQEQELRRQLQAERAARQALTYQADMRRAAQLAEVEDWPDLRALLDQYRPPAGAPDLRAWEWQFLNSIARKKQLIDRQEIVLQGPTEGIHQLAWSGRGERLAGVGNDGSIVVWDLKTGKELRKLGGRARFVSWDRDGRFLTVSAETKTVTLWPAERGPARRFFGPIPGLFNHRQPAFSPDGQRLALAVEKTTAAIYDASTGRELQRLAGHEALVSAVAWDPKGEAVATGSLAGIVRIWDAATGKETAALDADDQVEGVQWGADGKHIAAVTSRARGAGQVLIWELSRRAKVFTAEAQYGSTSRADQPRAGLFYSPDGQRVAAESIGGVTVWETAGARSIFQGPTGASGSQLGGCDPEVRRWAFLQMFGNRATCRVVAIETAETLFRVEVEIPMNRYQSALAWSPDGKRLAAGFSQGKVYVYNVPADRREVRVFNAGAARFFDWSPDGRRFAFASGGEVHVGSVPVTKPPTRLGAPLLLPSVVSLSPDGKYLAGAERDGTLPIWEVASGTLARRLAGHPPPLADPLGTVGAAVSALVWSPDGKRLASLRLGDGGLWVWDVAAGKVVTSLQFGGNQFVVPQQDALPLVWSPDSKFLALRIGWLQKKVRILDATTGRQIREWEGGPSLGSSNAMAWDPLGEKLATCLGNPPRIRIWSVSTGAETFELEDPVLRLSAMSWSPDGRRLAYLVDGCKVLDLTTKRSIALSDRCDHMVWKPDGSVLALFNPAFGRGDVRFYDPATGQAIPGERGVVRPDPSAIGAQARGSEGYNYHLQSVVWNEHGLQAAADAMAYPGMGMIAVWDVRTGKPLLTLGQIYETVAARVQAARMVAWSPDGRSLATLGAESNADARIDLWDAATGRKTRSIAAGRVDISGAAALAWSPDGGSLAFAAGPVQVWKLAAAGEPLTLRQPVKNGPEANHTFLSWSADSRSLAVLECRDTGGHEQVLTAWDLTTAKEQFRWTRPYEFSYLHAPLAFSPDGRRIAWGGPRPGVWSVAAGKEEFPLAGHGAPVIDVLWSPDGRRVITRSEVFGAFNRNFELKVWDVATAQEVMMLRGPMAGCLVAPGFGALASPPGMGSDPGDVLVWDLGPRDEKGGAINRPSSHPRPTGERVPEGRVRGRGEELICRHPPPPRRRFSQEGLGACGTRGGGYPIPAISPDSSKSMKIQSPDASSIRMRRPPAGCF
jgi:WD40 repeat protein